MEEKIEDGFLRTESCVGARLSGREWDERALIDASNNFPWTIFFVGGWGSWFSGGVTPMWVVPVEILLCGSFSLLLTVLVRWFRR